MHPRLFTLFEGSGWETAAPSYFILLVGGFLFATLVGVLWARRIGQDPDVIVDLGLAMLLAGVAGSRILHVFADGFFWDYVNLCVDPAKVDWVTVTRQECLRPGFGGVWDATKNVCHPAQADCFAWAKFWNGGFTFYGGLIGAIPAAWYLLKRDRFPFWKAADMAGITIALGLGLGRMGCFLAGCCFGSVSTADWALRFPPHSPASEAQYRDGIIPAPSQVSEPVHPTQLYEAGGALLIAFVLAAYVHGRKRYDGQVFVTFAAMYALLRFSIEFVRADDRGGLGLLSTSQIIGLGMVAFAVVAHRSLSTRTQRLREARERELVGEAGASA